MQLLVGALVVLLASGVLALLCSRWADRFARLRWLQQGILHVYLLYILVVVVAALAWMSLRTWSWPSGG